MSNLKTQIKKLEELIANTKTVLILQPEKPDTDSLSSSLALEAFLENLGKKVVMYCQDEIPGYIRVLDGWDRVTDTFPKEFDLTILVDTGGPNMILRTLEKHQAALTKRPFAIIDHHLTREAMPFPADEIIDPSCAANTELIYGISQELGWKVTPEIASSLVSGILADTAGFTNTNSTAAAVRTVADLVDAGADLHELYARKRAADALSPDLLHYKGQLLERVEFVAEGKVAVNWATPAELKEFSEMHDPADLVNKEALFSQNVLVSAFLRDYGGKIKISLRSEIDGVDKVAQSMGGGGHTRAAGIRVDDQKLEDVKKIITAKLTKLVEEHEALQHA